MKRLLLEWFDSISTVQFVEGPTGNNIRWVLLLIMGKLRQYSCLRFLYRFNGDGSVLRMDMAEETPMSVDEIASKLKCARGWVQLSIDAGCQTDSEGRLTVRDMMMFQLTNIHKIRNIAGLPAIEGNVDKDDLRPNVKAILTTQLEWLQIRSTKESVQRAAKLVCDKLQTISNI
ncbi:hypothetical protein MLD52_04335 [Puniceicoccaceae bacterium K14]|nr:hypothetical protein [Puniceicoccaceae bacterium K14]